MSFGQQAQPSSSSSETPYENIERILDVVIQHGNADLEVKYFKDRWTVTLTRWSQAPNYLAERSSVISESARTLASAAWQVLRTLQKDDTNNPNQEK